MNGDVVIINNKKGGFLSGAIRLFTRSNFTHTAIRIGDVASIDSVLSAEELISVLPMSRYFDKDIDLFVFSISKRIYEGAIARITKEMYSHYTGTKYGFFQLVWFVYRWLAETFNIDIRKQGNFFPEGTICSELIYYYFEKLAEEIEDAQLHNRFLIHLQQWNGNNFTPKDVYQTCLMFPEIFIKTYDSSAN